MECRLAGETEVLGGNLPQRHLCPTCSVTGVSKLQFEPLVLLIWSPDTRAVSGVPHGAGPVTSDRGVKNLRRPLSLHLLNGDLKASCCRDAGMWKEQES
jgi:hypothetical protein